MSSFHTCTRNTLLKNKFTFLLQWINRCDRLSSRKEILQSKFKVAFPIKIISIFPLQLLSLPTELLCLISKFFTLTDLWILRATCTTFHHIVLNAFKHLHKTISTSFGDLVESFISKTWLVSFRWQYIFESFVQALTNLVSGDITVHEACFLYVKNEFYQFFDSSSLLISIVTSLLGNFDNNVKLLMLEVFDLKKHDTFDALYTNGEYTTHYYYTAEFKARFLFYLLQKCSFKDSRIVLQLLPMDIYIELDKKQYGMILHEDYQETIDRFQYYRYEVIKINYYTNYVLLRRFLDESDIHILHPDILILDPWFIEIEENHTRRLLD
jgi:hypothetical protein